jgi:hypothetical protein
VPHRNIFTKYTVANSHGFVMGLLPGISDEDFADERLFERQVLFDRQ